MPETIQLFVTCILDTLYPETARDVVTVLERAGMQVNLPRGQTCCGQPAFNAGLRAEARKMAEHTIRVFESVPGPVVIPSGSCAAMIRHGYPELFASDLEWLANANALAGRTYELTEFLVDVLGVKDVGSAYEGLVTYHSSCHLLRELGVNRQPRLLLEATPGVHINELNGTDECCGFGGVFSVEYPEISAAMLERKIANLEASRAPVMVSCDAGCITNINGGLHRRGLPQRAVHIANILAK